MFLYGGSKSPPYEITPNYAGSQNKKYVSIPSTHRLYQFTHQNSNREVRHSLTWHSSESESALERFEPVAVTKLWRDGQGTLFAPVAARRQKEFKRWIDTYAKHVCRRRRDGSQSLPLFVLFVLFGQAKRTLKEKLLYYRAKSKYSQQKIK